MSVISRVVSVCALAFVLILPTSARTHREKKANQKTGFMNPIDTEALREDLRAAMAETLDMDDGQLRSMENLLRPTFRALPKNAEGRIELATLRHVVHRHFMGRYGFSLKAFEPHNLLNGSDISTAEILQDRAPVYVEELLRGRFKQNGFALEDAAMMVVTLEQLLLDDTERRVLEIVDQLGFKGGAGEAHTIMRAVLYQLDHNDRGAPLKPGWKQSLLYLYSGLMGELSRVHHERSGSAFIVEERFSLDEVVRATHSFILGYQNMFSNCDKLSNHLNQLDKARSGRVRLSDFYSSSTLSWDDGQAFDLKESQEWLRKLGALDESSAWMGPQVITANYVGATSNCRMHNPLYSICCPHRECEGIVTQLEQTLGAPAAAASDILPVVEGLTAEYGDASTMQSRRPHTLPSALNAKLEAVAEQNGGMVPLHGRLFSQWLHYVAPQECPFPHVRGSVIGQSFQECGAGCLVTLDEVEAVAGFEPVEPNAEEGEDVDESSKWLSQWSHEEELVHGGKVPSQGAWAGRSFRILAAALLLALAAISVAGLHNRSEESSPKGSPKFTPCLQGTTVKEHLV